MQRTSIAAHTRRILGSAVVSVGSRSERICVNNGRQPQMRSRFGSKKSLSSFISWLLTSPELKSHTLRSPNVPGFDDQFHGIASSAGNVGQDIRPFPWTHQRDTDSSLRFGPLSWNVQFEPGDVFPPSRSRVTDATALSHGWFAQ